MDVLEKTMLVNELKQLIAGLDNDKKTLYETAKAKQRIKDICAACDDPIFQNQLSPFKSYLDQEGFSSQELQFYDYELS